MTSRRVSDGRGRPALWTQLGVGLLLFGLYVAVDALDSPERRATALRHGRDILDLERWLHIDIEQPLNAWLEPHRLLATLANYEYAWTYILSAVALLIWVWVRHPDLWRPVRDSFIVLNLVAFATFLLFPTAPPRMLSGEGFVDTVSRGDTVGSWGSGPVDAANQLAAMPSLHVGWALWVSVGLARITARRSVQLLSAVHVLLTVYVVMATANHYLLDAVAVVVPIMIGTWYADWRYGDRGAVVPACDAFFLHVEETGAAQHVGGYVVFAPSPTDASAPDLAALKELVGAELVPRTRFHQRLAPSSRWRRPRWIDAEVDLDWHVVERTVEGEAGFRAVVAELAEQPLPRDRPMWRVVVARGLERNRSGFLIVVHHAMADGLGTITHCQQLIRPRMELPSGPPRPSLVQRAGATVVGLAQLATDGSARRLVGGTTERAYATTAVDFEIVREAARGLGVRVTDLVLALTTEAVHVTHPELAERTGGKLRLSVTQLVGAPGDGRAGNATAAVMVDLPLDGDESFEERVADVARRTKRLRRPTRAVASRFVMATGLRLLPEPAAAWFARTMYGGRTFHGVVSNLPGPPDAMTMAGTATEQVLPVLPIGPDAPLALGAMSWAGALGFGIATDPTVLDADALATRIATVAASLMNPGGPGEGEKESRAIAR